LIIFLAAQFPLYVGVGALLPVLPLFSKQFDLPQSMVGLVISLPSVAKLVLNFPMGQLADAWGRKVLMVSGMVLLALGDIGTGFSSTVPALFSTRLLTGAGIAVSDAGAQAWVADAFEMRSDERATFLGIQTALIGVAFVIGPMIGGKAVDENGPNVIFLAVAAGAIVCAAGYMLLPELGQNRDKWADADGNQWKASQLKDQLCADSGGPSGTAPLDEAVAVVKHEAHKEENEKEVTLEGLLAEKDQQGLAGISLAFYTGAAAKFTVIPAVATAAFGSNASEIGQFFSGFAAVGILGTLVGGKLADVIGPRNVLIFCGGLCAIAYGGAAFAVQATNKELFLGFLALWALAGAVKSPALQAFAIGIAPDTARGAALSVPKTVGDFTFVVAPFVLGFLCDQIGPESAFIGCAATFALGTGIFAASTE